MEKKIKLQEITALKIGPFSVSSSGRNAVKNIGKVCIIGGLTVVGVIAIKEEIQYHFYKKKTI